jgi:hypothetical protein
LLQFHTHLIQGILCNDGSLEKGATFAVEQRKKMNEETLSALDPSFHSPCPCKEVANEGFILICFGNLSNKSRPPLVGRGFGILLEIFFLGGCWGDLFRSVEIEMK